MSSGSNAWLPRLCAIAILGGIGATHAASAPQIADFLSGARLDDVSVSPDGRYLALIIRQDGRRFVAVQDRRNGNALKHIAEAKTKELFAPQWCRWANPTRVLCSFAGLASERGRSFPMTRLIGVNADGSDLKVLGNHSGGSGTQFEDHILDWTPEDPRTVLVELDQGEGAGSGVVGTDGLMGGYPDGFPEVYSLDVYSGQLHRVMRDRPPIAHFVSDGHGNVRLGTGYVNDKIVELRASKDRTAGRS